ncbi:MAG: Uma2 family endonuclease [Acidobacteriota bacterium]|nr:Uma2 family endonuclease [Acidobacteriota bacterium]
MTMEALMEHLKYPEEDFEAGLPTMDDLPSEYPEDKLVPDTVHPNQCSLLTECLLLQLKARGLTEYLIAEDLDIHFDKDHPHRHKRPDWFLALGTSPVYNAMNRKSYLIWHEKVRPYLVLEILSKSTEKEDLGLTDTRDGVPTKWQVYQDILKVPNYVCFDSAKGALKAFRRGPDGYVPVAVPKSGVWFEELELGLRIWSGRYREKDGPWLRFFDHEDKLIPTEAEEKERERAEKVQERVEKERAIARESKERAEKKQALARESKERAEKERLLAILKAAGIDPGNV